MAHQKQNKKQSNVYNSERSCGGNGFLLLKRAYLKMSVSVLHGNILEVVCDAIVNPANVSLLRGSGLCGIIHKAAGLELEKACKEFGRQNEGDVVLTSAFALSNCSYVLHACGPRWYDGEQGEPDKLRKVYRKICELALKKGIKSVAIPAISTGIYRFPFEQAAYISIETVRDYDLDVYIVLHEHEKFLQVLEMV